MKDDGTFTFQPDGKGESRQENLKKVGDSRLYSTIGEKQQCMVMHLKAPSSCADPVAKMYDDFRKLSEGLSAGVKLPTPQGTVLEKNDDYRVVVNQAGGEVKILISIDLQKDVEFMKKYNSLTYSISQTLYRNEDMLKKVCREQARKAKNVKKEA
jgi:hypothetical protein